MKEHPVRISAAPLVIAALLVGCKPPPGEFESAPHAPLPLVTDNGGPVLDSIQLVSLIFQEDARRPQLQRFGEFLVHSQWLPAVGAEYGVGNGTSFTTI